jgi:hypothetical protein
VPPLPLVGRGWGWGAPGIGTRPTNLDLPTAHPISEEMRPLIALLLLAAPVQAWDFTPTPLCTISEDTPALAIRVTYDPSQPEPYAITLTRPDPWPATETFGLRFDGPAAMTIGTDRHRLSEDGKTLTVTDTGFGNVLDGLAFNATAAAIAGQTEVPFDLAGAAPAVEAFRACGIVPSA